MGGFTIFMIVLGGGTGEVAPVVNYVLCVCEAQLYAPGASDVEIYRPGADEVQLGCEC